MDKSIKVLQLISSLATGGAETLLVETVKHSLNLNSGVEFEVVVMNDVINSNLKSELLKVCPTAVFLNRKEGHVHPKYFFELFKIIIQRKVRIIHSHNLGSKTWALVCKFVMPWLKIVHTLHTTNIFQKSSSRELFFHRHFINMNIAISNAVLKEAETKGIRSSTLIYNGIDVKKFKAQRKQPQPSDVLKIVNVARITHQHKGQDILIKAIAQCKSKGANIKCSFIGGIYEYDKPSFDYLKTLIKEFNLENDIEFLGIKNNVHELLPNYDLFVLSSRYEGLGLVVLEAMAAGLPVIASDIDGPKELVQHGENGLLFEPTNHLDLASKIMEFYNDKKRMYNIATRGCDYVNNFDISIMCKKYHELYKKLLKEQ